MLCSDKALSSYNLYRLDIRCAVVRKRATRDLQRAQARLHLVQGFLLAMNDLDKARTRPHAAASSCLYTSIDVSLSET